MKLLLARHGLWGLGTLGAIGVCLANTAQAQSPSGNVARGQALADKYCTQCHVVVRNGPAGWTDAPSFAAIADGPNATAARLEAIMQRPHMHMVNLPRSREEAAELSAYILSLKQSP